MSICLAVVRSLLSGKPKYSTKLTEDSVSIMSLLVRIATRCSEVVSTGLSEFHAHCVIFTHPATLHRTG